MNKCNAKGNTMRSIKDMINDRRMLIVFFITIMIMIIAHGLSFTNIVYCHDALSFNDFDLNFPDQIRLGRFINPLILVIRRGGAPFLTGICSILFISLAVLVTVDLLDLKLWQSIIVIVVFTTNLTLISLYGVYWHYVDIYSIAIFISCLAVYTRYRLPRILNIILPIMCLIITLAMYQTYMCMTIGLFLFMLIKDIDTKRNWRGVKSLIKEGAIDCLILAVGIILYWFIMNRIAQIYMVPISNDYNGPGNVSGVTIRGMIKSIPDTYDYFKSKFFDVTKYNTGIIISLNRILLCITIFELLIIGYKIIIAKWNIVPFVLVIACIIVAPLCLNSFYLISNGVMHNHMIFAYNLIYLLPLVLWNTIERLFKGNISNVNVKIRKIVLIGYLTIFIIICLHNIIYSNGYYAYTRLVYDNTLANTQTIWKDVNSIDGYVEGETEVIFMGSFAKSAAAYHGSMESDYLGVVTGASPSAITYDNRIGYFFGTVMGKHMNLSYNNERFNDSEIIKIMPSYPKAGYCRYIDGRVIVKMSD